MKLRTRKSFMPAGSEGRAPVSKGATVTQKLYMLLLIAILSYLAYLGFKYLRYIETYGQVIIEKAAVSASRGGRIQSIEVHSGQSVRPGQLLVTLEPYRICNAVETEDTRLEKIRHDIRVAKGSIAILEKELSISEKNRPNASLRRALEINRGPEPDLQQWLRGVEQLRNQLDSERVALRSLERRQAEVENLASVEPPLDPECAEEKIVAPYEAQVMLTKKRAFEYTNRGEAILVLERVQAPVSIDAYFELEHLPKLAVGQLVTIIFPDKSRDQARIAEISSDARQHQDRAWSGYRPLKGGILANLQPINETSSANWRHYDRMEVVVRVER